MFQLPSIGFLKIALCHTEQACFGPIPQTEALYVILVCLLYTSDAADE